MTPVPVSEINEPSVSDGQTNGVDWILPLAQHNSGASFLYLCVFVSYWSNDDEFMMLSIATSSKDA